MDVNQCIRSGALIMINEFGKEVLLTDIILQDWDISLLIQKMLSIYMQIKRNGRGKNLCLKKDKLKRRIAKSLRQRLSPEQDLQNQTTARNMAFSILDEMY